MPTMPGKGEREKDRTHQSGSHSGWGQECQPELRRACEEEEALGQLSAPSFLRGVVLLTKLFSFLHGVLKVSVI